MEDAGLGEVVDEAAALIVACLVADSGAAASSWESAHPDLLVGSSRVLQHIAATFPGQLKPMLASTYGSRCILDLLEVMRAPQLCGLEVSASSSGSCSIVLQSASYG
jgi:hypothetical protein